MTDDNDRTDDMIRNAASEYNRPPAVPRDEMWTAIQAARSAHSAPRLHIVAGGGYAASRRFSPRYAWFGAAAAAVLLVATGVGIGRWTSSNADVERRIADAPSLSAPVVTGDGIVAPDNRNAAPSENGFNGPATESPSGSSQRDVSQRPVTARTREDIRRNPVVVGNGDLQSVSYQVATQQHLQDAEALLTSFSSESRDERMNAQFAGWAKGLLSNTRLLLDSPAGDDPRRARLLQDLELVLAQIVQLSPNTAASDRELIQGSIQNGLVMARLRSAIPAGQPREITER